MPKMDMHDKVDVGLLVMICFVVALIVTIPEPENSKLECSPINKTNEVET